MERFIPPFYLAAKVSRLSGMPLVWVVLLSAICFFTSPAFSQDVFWGLTSGGGPSGAGTVFSLKSSGSDFAVHHPFQIPRNPINPTGGLTLGSDGNLYGMAQSSDDSGTIFKIDADGSDFSVLKNFNYSDGGAYPRGSLMEGSDGYLYGVTSSGGGIFKIGADGSDFAVIHGFTDGSSPVGSLMEGSDGYLYGMTQYVGNDNGGTIFKISIDGSGFADIHSFNGTDPVGSLMEGSDGYLYGMTQYGGDNNSGTIFKIGADGSGFTVLKNFTSADGSPADISSLVEGSDEYLYGVISKADNSGTIFKIGADGSGFTVLKNFTSSTDGVHPIGSLTLGNDGYLYGMTEVGGSYGRGTIFKIGTDGSNFFVLKNFIFSIDGSGPSGGLIEGSDSYFYGVTYGGTNGHGTIFKIAPDGTGYTVLKNFQGSTDGSGPSGGLMEGSDGYLYGMAGGGINDTGIIYKIAPDGTGYTVLHHFDSWPYTEGAHPIGNLTESSRGGYLFGVTSSGTRFEPDCGDNGCWIGTGAMFAITLDGTGYSVDIFPYSDYNPSSSLIKDRDGNLYGMAVGVVWDRQPSGMIYRNYPSNVLKTFDYTTEGIPIGDLTLGSDGYLYGTTSKDEYNGVDGTFFRIATDGSGFTILKYFDTSTDGISPEGNLVEGSDGYFYGTTSTRGSYNAGTIYKIAPDGSGFTIVRSFNPSTDGASPTRLLIQKGKKPTVPALQVNFQNKHTQTPAGWLKDYGLPFSEKQLADSTLTYGWKRRDTAEPINLSVGGNFPGNEGNGRWRPAPADPLLATLMHMQGDDVKNFRGTPVESYWELAVENGEYLVTVSVGDGYRYTYSDHESHSINVEGVAAITHFVPQGSNGSLTRFKQAVVKVTVSDGLLTIDADGGQNTKINYAIIQPLSSSAAIARKDFSAQETESQAQLSAYPNPFASSLTLTMPQWQGQVKVSLNNVVGMNLYTTQQEIRAGELSLNLSGLKLTPGMYVLKLTAEDGTTKLLKIYRQ